MTYADLFIQTLANRTARGDKDLKGLRSATNKFLKLAGLRPESECEDKLLTKEHLLKLRAQAEHDGDLKSASSSSWSSRMMHVSRTWRDLKAAANGTTFASELNDAMKQAKISRDRLARLAGVSPSAIYQWAHGRSMPCESKRAVITEIDKVLGLKGRLEASLSGVMLFSKSGERYDPEEIAKFRSGDGDLHDLVRFWCNERKLKFSPTLREASFRKSVVLYFASSGFGPRPASVRLVPGDLTAFESLDRKLDAEGKLIAAFKRTIESQTPLPPSSSFPYADWSASLKDEFLQLEQYKFDNPKGLERTVLGRWTSTTYANGCSKCPTRFRYLKMFEFIFGYALGSGIVKSPSDLRLAHITVPEIFIGALRSRMKRTKRTSFNKGDTGLITTLFSLIYGGDETDSGLGYFANDSVGQMYWSDPFFERCLPLLADSRSQGGYRIFSGKRGIPADDLAGRWQAYLQQVWRTMSKFLRSTPIKNQGKYYKSVADILSNPDFDITTWLKGGFERLVTLAPARDSSPVAWARHVRLCVLYMALVTRGFRRSTLFRMELQHIVFNPSTGKYNFAIPEDLFKQRGKGGSKGGVQAEVDDVLSSFERSRAPLIPSAATALLNLYLKEARPLLGIHHDSLFGFDSFSGFDSAVVVMSIRALGRPVRFHAFRYLLATWAKRLGLSVEETADILGHLPSATKAIYDLTNAQDTGRRTNASIKRIFCAA